VQFQNAVRTVRQPDVVSHDDEGSAARLARREQHPQHLRGGLFVQISRGLIGEQYGRLVRERTGDRDPLLFAAGQAVDGAVESVAEADLGENGSAAPSGRGTADPVELEGEAHILLDVERGYEIEELVHEAEMSASKQRALRFRHRGHDPASDRHLTAVGVVDSADDIQQGRFAGAAAAHDGHHFTGVDAGIDPVEHPVHAGTLGEAAAELADDDQGLIPERAAARAPAIYNPRMRHVVARTMVRSAAVAAATLLGCSSLAFAQGMSVAPTQAKPQSPAQTKSQGSYSLGLSMGESLRRAAVGANDISTQRLMQGLRDGLSGKATFGQQNQLDIRTLIVGARAAVGNKNHAAAKAFLVRNGRKKGVVTTADGLQYEVLKPGQGSAPKMGDSVTVNYRGTLLDGKEFDSSYARHTPATFEVGRVIPGWNEALQLMKPGAKYKLFIPPQLAYDLSPPMGAPIPPGAMLIFDVDLLSVQPPKPAAAPTPGMAPHPVPAPPGQPHP
jgi:FKBP-type peptidyl-prolyl cis-trans isomerase